MTHEDDKCKRELAEGIRRAQEIVKRRVGKERSLAGELLTERRAEAAND